MGEFTDGMQQTSIEAWLTEAKPLAGKNQQKVLKVIQEHSAMCNQDIADVMQWPINSVTPRVLELREAEVIEFSHKDKHPRTGRTVNYWRAA